MEAATVKPPTQCAINVSLIAYDPGLETMPQSQRIGFAEAKRNTKVTDLTQGQYTVPPIQPTTKEASVDRAPLIGLWVGMYLPSARNGQDENSKGKSVNTLALNVGLTILPTDPMALRVVVLMNRQTATYYALIDPDDSGLCTGVNVLVSDVLFFPQYRTDTQTDIQKRKSEWSELVRRISNPVEKDNMPKKYDTTKFQVPLRRSLANEISMHIGAYREGADPSKALTAAIKLIDEADTDIAFTSPPKNTSLAKLVSSKVMTARECESALAELLVSTRVTHCGCKI
jgi:hypothetical protein